MTIRHINRNAPIPSGNLACYCCDWFDKREEWERRAVLREVTADGRV